VGMPTRKLDIVAVLRLIDIVASFASSELVL
jgi:hypothetical protein